MILKDITWFICILILIIMMQIRWTIYVLRVANSKEHLESIGWFHRDIIITSLAIGIEISGQMIRLQTLLVIHILPSLMNEQIH